MVPVIDLDGGSRVLDSDYFLTIAELAVALAGFGSLAALIGRRSGPESAAVDAARLRMMVEHSLATMLLAVLPVSLARFDLSPHFVWVTSGVIFAISTPCVFWAGFRRVARIRDYNPGLAYRVSGLALLILTPCILVAGLGGLIPLGPAYGLALVVQLSVASLTFLRVASSLMAGHGSTAG